MAHWYKILSWFGNLNPYISGVLIFFALVPLALALRGPLGFIRWYGIGVFLDWLDSVADPRGYRPREQMRQYTPLTPRRFWLITVCLWGLGILVATAFWWIDQRY